MIHLWKAFLLGGLFLLSSCARHYEIRFPIDYTSEAKLPCTNVQIEGHMYPFLFDLGASPCFAISSLVIEELQHKTRQAPAHVIDAQGNEYLLNTYLIPAIRVHNLWIRNVEVSETTTHFVANSIVSTKDRKPAEIRALEEFGTIGRRLFVENYNLLLDFHNSLAMACCHLHHRIRDGYQIHQLVQTPLGIGFEEGLFLEIDTDLGVKRFMIDTGSSCNFIKPSLIQDRELQEHPSGILWYRSSQFVIGGKDFGPQKLFLLDIAPVFSKIDGILGMTFLKKHVVYLDFRRKMAYVGKASEVIPSPTKD